MRNNSGIKAKTGHLPPGKCFCLIQLILFWKFSPELKWILRTWPSPVRSLPLSLPTSTIYLSQVQCLRKSSRVHPLIHIFHLSVNKAWTERDFVQKSSVYATLARHFLSSAAEKRAGRICLGMKLGLRAAMARQVLQRVHRGGLLLEWHLRWGRLDHDGGKDRSALLSPPGDAAASGRSAGSPNRWAQQLFTHGTCVFGAFTLVSVTTILFHKEQIWYPKHVLRVNPKSFFFVISKTYVWFFLKLFKWLSCLETTLRLGDDHAVVKCQNTGTGENKIWLMGW